MGGGGEGKEFLGSNHQRSKYILRIHPVQVKVGTYPYSPYALLLLLLDVLFRRKLGTERISFLENEE